MLQWAQLLLLLWQCNTIAKRTHHINTLTSNSASRIESHCIHAIETKKYILLINITKNLPTTFVGLWIGNTELEESSWICCSCKCTLLFAKADISTSISNVIVLHKHGIFLCGGNGAEFIPTYLTAASFLANVTHVDHQCKYHVQYSPLDPSISNSSHWLWMLSHASPSWCWFLSSLRFSCHADFLIQLKIRLAVWKGRCCHQHFQSMFSTRDEDSASGSDGACFYFVFGNDFLDFAFAHFAMARVYFTLLIVCKIHLFCSAY